MDYSEIVAEAANTLGVNKLRTFLAVLGIIIGIGSVIALVSLGQASQKSVENQIQSLGANLLTVSPGRVNSGNVRGAGGGAETLTVSDALAIRDQLAGNVKDVSPEYSGRSQVTAGRNNTNTQVIGTESQYQSIHKINVAVGSFISDTDVNSLGRVVVLGATAANDLFPNEPNPVGQSVRIGGQSMRVIGVIESKGGAGFNNPDDAIYVPLTTAQKILFGVNHLSSIAVEAASQDVMVTVQDQIGYLLLQRHKLDIPADADFSIFSQNDILDTATQVTGTFTGLLSGIAAISLLVGGIGIMNIMLVTVTERTREIGLRKALGAKKKVIIAQFLVEAVLLTIIGGFIGMLLGIGVSLVLSSSLGLPLSVSPASVVLAMGVSGGVGILFGYYPARKAAGLQPIDALRYE